MTEGTSLTAVLIVGEIFASIWCKLMEGKGFGELLRESIVYLINDKPNIYILSNQLVARLPILLQLAIISFTNLVNKDLCYVPLNGTCIYILYKCCMPYKILL